ncbi:MAG: hypothetical protein LBE97_02415 [Holosporales bacterium]|jgi:hypothetical protein|nr:hypothetical protein [Holosporales bacterium]
MGLSNRTLLEGATDEEVGCCCCCGSFCRWIKEHFGKDELELSSASEETPPPPPASELDPAQEGGFAESKMIDEVVTLTEGWPVPILRIIGADQREFHGSE